MEVKIKKDLDTLVLIHGTNKSLKCSFKRILKLRYGNHKQINEMIGEIFQ